MLKSSLTIPPYLDKLIAECKPGFSLPQPFYTDEAVFRLDLERVFSRRWLFAGHTCQIPRPGDYFTFEVGPDSLILIRKDDGQIQALFNTCRHRGSRLCTQSSGHVGKIVCPYHQWAYECDGRLVGARDMGGGFDRSLYSLHSAHVRVLHGLIFVCLADKDPDFESARRAIEPHVRPHGLERAKVCHMAEYTIRANWKVVFENNRECYHCPIGHPEFCRSNYDLGMPGDGRSNAHYEQVLQEQKAYWRSLGLETEAVNFPNGEWFRAARMPLRDGYVTESLDGKPVAPLMGDLQARGSGSLRVITLPNAWFHADSDYASSTQLIPLGPALTRARIMWFVDEAARPGVDYDPERVVALWKITCEQDWQLCENNQAGIQSTRYQPGPFSPLTEAGVETFGQWYLRQLSAGSAGQVTENQSVVSARHSLHSSRVSASCEK
jgi:Rieske 2Fe-2S family protein